MITDNQNKAISILTDNYKKFKLLTEEYGKLRNKYGLHSVVTSDKNSLKSALNGLLKKGIVEYKFKGLWRLKKK